MLYLERARSIHHIPPERLKLSNLLHRLPALPEDLKGLLFLEGQSTWKLNTPGVGFVPVEKYDRFKQLLEAVRIDNVESSEWNRQDWSLAALDCLRAEGLVAEEYPNNVIQYWLRENQ